MIKVRLTENINKHLKKGIIGEISNTAYDTYGIGKQPEMVNNIEVFIDNDSQFILNTKLEIA